LNVTFSGDINTTDNNPLRFRSATGRLMAGVQFDAPLTRVAERNAYRAAQINYQQTRRNYYAFEDRVDQLLRTSLRDIRLTELNFELLREAVWLAAGQVDQTRLSIARPPRPGEQEGPGGINSGRNLVQALQGLNNAQNNLMNAWVDTEVQRMNLDFNLGTMRLDDNGLWIDPGPIDQGYGLPREGPPPDQSPDGAPPGDAPWPAQPPAPGDIPTPGASAEALLPPATAGTAIVQSEN
jgi:outer membrane protein TolC